MALAVVFLMLLFHCRYNLVVTVIGTVTSTRTKLLFQTDSYVSIFINRVKSELSAGQIVLKGDCSKSFRISTSLLVPKEYHENSYENSEVFIV